jgi:uncharacterized protein YraI
MSRKSWSAIAFALLVSGASTVLAESVWVQSDGVNILGGKGSIYPTVATVKKGQELQVLGRDGKWVNVQIANGPTGWVFESNLSAKKVGGDLFSGLRGDSAAGLNTAAAARGWDPATDQYATTKGMSKAPMDHLLQIKKSISPQEWEAFMRPVLQAAGMPVPPPSAPQTPVIQPQATAGGYTPPAQPSYTPQGQPSYTPQNPAGQQGRPYAPQQQPQQPVAPRPPTYTPPQNPYTPQGQPYTPQPR